MYFGVPTWVLEANFMTDFATIRSRDHSWPENIKNQDFSWLWYLTYLTVLPHTESAEYTEQLVDLWVSGKQSLACHLRTDNQHVYDKIPRRTLTLWSAEEIYGATSNDMKLVHWPLIGGLLHLVQRGDCSPPTLFLAVPNVTDRQRIQQCINHYTAV